MNQAENNLKTIIIWGVGTFLSVIFFVLLLKPLFKFTLNFGDQKLGYTLVPQTPNQTLPAFVAKDILIEEINTTKDKNWLLKIKLVDFPQKITDTDIAKIQFRLLQNFCSSPASLRTTKSIYHDIYNNDKKIAQFTMKASICDDFLSYNYVNKYYPDIFKAEVNDNIEANASNLPIYISQDIAIRKISVNWVEKNLTTEYTVFSQTPQNIDYEKEKEKFLIGACQQVLDKIFNHNGYSYKLDYYNPQGDKIYSSDVPAYRCQSVNR